MLETVAECLFLKRKIALLVLEDPKCKDSFCIISQYSRAYTKAEVEHKSTKLAISKESVKTFLYLGIMF